MTGQFKQTGQTRMNDPVALAAPATTPMTRTGYNGQVISLNGTNGLTDGSYTSSGVYDPTYAAKHAFDGHDLDANIINADTTIPYDSLGIYGSLTNTNEWIVIDFAQEVVGISGISFYSHPGALTWEPQNVQIQVWEGSWVTKDTFVNPANVGRNERTFPSKITAPDGQVRILMLDNRGGGFIETAEIELLQDPA